VFFVAGVTRLQASERPEFLRVRLLGKYVGEYARRYEFPQVALALAHRLAAKIEQLLLDKFRQRLVLRTNEEMPTGKNPAGELAFGHRLP
jgi:hypothetical protein